jgi:hypothetical protein
MLFKLKKEGKYYRIFSYKFPNFKLAKVGT